MQELARFALLAQAAQPVLAHDALFRADVLVGAVVAAEADALLEVLADVADDGVSALGPAVVDAHGLPHKRLKVKVPKHIRISHILCFVSTPGTF